MLLAFAHSDSVPLIHKLDSAYLQDIFTVRLPILVYNNFTLFPTYKGTQNNVKEIPL